MSALSDLIASANTARLSARAIARGARDEGLSLNHDTAARYLRGDHGRPDEATLLAFSAVLQIPLAELRVAADLPAEETEPYLPPVEASRLSRRQRRAVDEIIRAMLDVPAAEQEARGELRAVAARDVRRVARHGDSAPPRTEPGR